jgi:hypothetical protein
MVLAAARSPMVAFNSLSLSENSGQRHANFAV